MTPTRKSLQAIVQSLEHLGEFVIGKPAPYIKNLIELALGLTRHAEAAKLHREACHALVARAGEVVLCIAAAIRGKEGDLPRNLGQNVAELETVLRDIGAFTLELASRRWISLVTKRGDLNATIMAHNERLSHALTKFMVEGTINVQMDVDHVVQGVDRIDHLLALIWTKQDGHAHDQEEREDLAYLRRCLPYAEAGWDPEQQCLAGTRTKVLEEIMSWAFSDDEPNVLWLRGMAGCGKTTIAHSAAARLYKNGLASCFFFKRDIIGKNSPQNLFSTTATDLAGHNMHLRLGILQALQKDEGLGGRALFLQFNELIEKPIETFISSSSARKADRIFIIWDALNECCDLEARRGLLHILEHRITAISPSLRLLITSRPTPEIESFMKTIGSKTLGLSAETENTKADIDLYIKHRLKRVAMERKTKGWPNQEDVPALVERSVGLFIWASTAMNFIQRGLNPEHQLRRILDNDSCPAAEVALDRLYSLAISEPDLDGFPEGFQIVVGAIVGLQKPLPIPALSQLIGKEEEWTWMVVDQLQAVLSPVTRTNHSFNCRSNLKHHGTVSIFHPSFFEFLTTSTRCIPPQLYINIDEQQARLATSCLTLMAKLLHRDMLEINELSVLNSDVCDLSVRLEQHVSQALQYACCFWPDHVLAAPDKASLLPLLEDFYSKNLLFWLELMSLRNQYPKARLTLTRINHLITSTPVFQKLRPIAYEAVHFAEEFALIITEAAGQVYTTAIRLTPRASVVYQTYHHMCAGEEDSYERQAVQGHTDWVRSVAVSDDTRVIASGSNDQTVRIWDSGTGETIRVLEGHTSVIGFVRFSPDDRYILSCSADCTVRVWVLETGDLLLPPLQGHAAKVRCVAFSQDGRHIVTGSDDRIALIWETTNVQTPSRSLKGHNDSVRSVDISTDGCRVASASSDNTIRIWDIRTGEGNLPPLTGHIDSVRVVRFSYDGRLLVSGSNDCSVRVWSAETGDALIAPIFHSTWVRMVAFSHDSSQIASGSLQGKVRVFDATTGQCLLPPLTGLTARVRAVEFSQDDRHIIAASNDRVICVWDAQTGAVVRKAGGVH